MKSANYLGHVASTRRLQKLAHTSDAIYDSNPHITVTELKLYSESCNVFEPRPPCLTRAVVSLNKNLQKDEPKRSGQLTHQKTVTMEARQDELISPPVLALPRHTRNICYRSVLEMCKVGCVRLQNHEDDTNQAIGYRSLSLDDARGTYEVIHGEFFSVASAALLLRPHKERANFAICTDHDS